MIPRASRTARTVSISDLADIRPDATCFEVLYHLFKGPVDATTLSRRRELDRRHVSRLFRSLLKARLIEKVRMGRSVVCRIRASAASIKTSDEGAVITLNVEGHHRGVQWILDPEDIARFQR